MTGKVDEETLREPVGQMLSKKARGVGKAEKATVEKLLKNPNQTNSNEVTH